MKRKLNCKFFLLFLLIYYSFCSFGQIQKIIPDTSKFKDCFIAGVAIYNNISILNYQEYLNPSLNFNNYIIYEKNGNKKFTYLQAEKFDIKEDFNNSFSPPLFSDKIVACTNKSPYSIFKTLTFENGKFWTKDSLFFDSIYSIRNHTINKDWMICRTEYISGITNIISSDKFFKRLDNKWVLKDSFDYSRPIAQSQTSPSLKYKITDRFAIIGVPNDENDGKDKGFVNVYELMNGDWKLFKRMKQPDPNQLINYFGVNVSISPDNHFLAISSRNIDQGNEYYSIYIFELINDDFILKKKLVEPVQTKNWGFNQFFEITEDELLVGLPYAENGKGIIRYYKYTIGDWTRGRDIHPPVWDTYYELFGQGIDRSKETVITGAPNDTEQNGAAYIFQLPARDSITTSVCQGEGYTLGDSTYYEAGIYRDTLIASYGVDSVVLLDLHVLPVHSVMLDTVLCEGQSMTVGNQEIAETGSYEIELQDINGCDSIINIKLMVVPREYPVTDTVICKGQTIIVGNEVISEPGSYQFDLSNINGCDSIVRYKVQVIPPDNVSLDTFFCQGSSIIINGEQITEAGSYQYDLQNIYGCDSLVNYNVVVIPPDNTTIDTTLCEDQSITIGDEEFSEQGIFSIELKNRHGCDSIVTLDLRIVPRETRAIDTLLCMGQSISIEDQTITEEGSYTFILTNIMGCDSIVTVKVGVSEIDLTSDIIHDLGCNSGAIDITIAGNNPPYQYRWNTGSDTEDLLNAHEGSYDLQVTDKTGCSYSFSFEVTDSIAYLIPEVFIPDDQNEELNRTFKVFMTDQSNPNPRVNILNTDIFDRWGEKVFSSAGSEFWDGTFRNAVLPAGVYLYRIVIESPCGVETLKGQVSLLR